jgi:peptide/nickel transport system permease protein
MLLAVILLAIFASQIAPEDPYSFVHATTEDIFAPPGSEHLLGQDDAGRDILSSVIYGGRISLIVGFVSSSIAILFGTTVGMVAGYVGGKVDIVLMRIVDGILVIPYIPLILVVIAIVGRGITNIILVIGFLGWTYMARVVRSQVLSVKERHFILRARSIGVGHLGIMINHILPQALPVIFAQVTLDVSFAILTEATLSFLGLGDPTLVSWGGMLHRAFVRGAVSRNAWWYLIPPGLALAWVTLSLAFLSNAIQGIVNPRLKTHHLFNEHKMIMLGQRSAGQGSAR